MSGKSPELSRALLALIFAVAFLANGGAGLWVSLSATPMHVNGLSAVVTVFGLVALAAAVQQFHRAFSSPAQPGRGTSEAGGGGSPRRQAGALPPSASPPPPPLRKGGDCAPMISERA